MRLLFIFFLLIQRIYGQYRDGDVRLVGGSYQWEGRVEIYFSGTWGTITDSEWTSNDAQAVCRRMGHFKPGAIACSNAYFGEGNGSIHLNSIQCSGLEYNVTDCKIQNISGITPNHSLDVGVKCQTADEAYREGDIRLVGGPHDWEGRVEIFWMGSWGTISDSSWSVEDAIVVCRQLHHFPGDGVLIPCCDMYGEGDGDIHIFNVTCDGSEDNITSCTYYNNDTVYTDHQQDVRVQCQQGNEGEIRLIGSVDLVQHQYRVYGRVEIFLFGVWGTVSDDGADTYDARVVCRQLGYNTYNVQSRCCEEFGQGIGLIHFRNPLCNGLEYRLSDCQYDNNTMRESHDEDWGVHCYTDGPEPGDVRLRSTYYNDYVEVFLTGRWVPIANTGNTWTQANSVVVCRQLGYAQDGTSWINSSYNAAFDQVDNVVCNGTEEKLRDCTFDITSSISNAAIKMKCGSQDVCIDGDMRLVDGDTEREGRVEICSSRRWGTVCGKYWTRNHTAVVCRQLGFSDIIGDSTYFMSEKFGRGTGPILMDYVKCTASEPRLWGKCTYFTHYYGCSHTDDVGVHCQPASCSESQVKLTEGLDEQSGRVEICSNQRWETFSSVDVTSSAATIICKELGYENISYSTDFECLASNRVDPYRNPMACDSFIDFMIQNSWRRIYGTHLGPKHSNYYQCTGREQRLSQCKSYNDTTLNSKYAAGIACDFVDCVDGEVRLVEGNTDWEGRLEVCFNQRWNTIESEGWTLINSHVVCNDLGYDITEKVNRPSVSQSPSKPVYGHNIVCPRSAMTLSDCSYTKYPGNIKDVIEVTISCQRSSCNDGDLKLVGEQAMKRLEICFDQRWTTINGNRWRSLDTQVACKQLGYPASDTSHTTIMRSSESLPVKVSDFACYGTEERLVHCTHSEYKGTKYTAEDVYISCDTEDVPTIDTTTVCGDNCDTGGTESDKSSSQMISIFIACLVIVLVCLLMVVGLVAGYFIVKRKRKRGDKENATKVGNITSTDGVKDVITGDNVSYVPSTGQIKSSQGEEASTQRQQQPLPPIPMIPAEAQDHGMVDHVYDTCK